MMFREDGFRPTDERGFIHKTILGGISKVAGILPIPGAGIIGGVAGLLAGAGKQKARPTIPRTQTARPTIAGAQGKQLGRQLKFGNGNGGVALTTTAFAPGVQCVAPAVLDPSTGTCVTRKPGVRGAIERFLPGGQTGFIPVAQQFGDAVMGQFGAALQPVFMTIQRRVCLRGMQLATDGLCYNKGTITNKQREWPRGRRPLLTGGDMRAIGVAARAGAKLDRTTKRLRTLGMMKKLPAPRRAAPHPHAKPVAAVSV